MGLMIIEYVENYLGIDRDDIIHFSNIAPKTYKKYHVDKKNGGKRIIYQPSKETKALQYAIIDLLLKKIDVHDSAKAYIKGKKSPLKKNAQEHVNYPYTIRVDFKDFFPSIEPNDLLIKIRSRFGDVTNEEEAFLTNSLFIKENRKYFLTIGAPSSPMISNIVMYNIDEELEKYSTKNNGVYSRYSDDIYYSTREKRNRNEFLKFLGNYLQSIKTPKLTINEDKTIYMSKARRRKVAGIIITSDKKISIGRDKKKEIKQLLYKNQQKKLEWEEVQKLNGYMAFLKDIEPEYHKILKKKYDY